MSVISQVFIEQLLNDEVTVLLLDKLLSSNT